MQTRTLTFPGAQAQTLSARLDLPSGRVQASAIFAHCFTCSKDSVAARRIARRLSALGLAVLRFDFTGLGQSEGDFSATHFSSQVADLASAAAEMERQGLTPSLLIGHSLGGAAVLAAAGSMPSVRAVATIGAPADPAHVACNFGADLQTIRTRGSAQVNLGGRPFTITRAFLEDMEGHNLATAIGALNRALLVLHAPGDTVVGIDNAARIFMAARHPKSFVTLDDADHLLTRDLDATYAADVIAAWAARYLDLKAPAAPKGAPEGVVRVSEVDPAGFLQSVSAGPHHHLHADEPVAVGGTDQGFTPYQLLSAGLGACTAMTIRMYARRKGWPLADVSVDVTHDKIHASDCAHCETESGRIDQFRRIIRLVGDLDDAQRERLMEIADRCPVHRSLEAEIEVVTEAG